MLTFTKTSGAVTRDRGKHRPIADRRVPVKRGLNGVSLQPLKKVNFFPSTVKRQKCRLILTVTIFKVFQISLC